MKKPVRKYLSIDDIQQEYLPISKKKIRCFVKKYLDIIIIGSRMYIEREAFENVLNDPDRESLSLNYRNKLLLMT